MRRFYIFNINKEFKTLNEYSPYNLYKTFNSLYHQDKWGINYSKEIYKMITSPFNRIKLNKQLYNSYINDEHYTKYLNTHLYNNYYSNEITKLSLGYNYIVIDTTISYPTFFYRLRKNTSLFVIDFQNQDYFWLDNIA